MSETTTDYIQSDLSRVRKAKAAVSRGIMMMNSQTLKFSKLSAEHMYAVRIALSISI
ncbi:hypothetical protein Plhal304r1_c048g0129991 [Plasmopara halstedii]